jgi:hypothetical protein
MYYNYGLQYNYGNIPSYSQLGYSYVRLLHASPNAPAVDVYADGKLIAGNLVYTQFTPYMKLQKGKYNIKVFAAGTTKNSVIDTVIELPEGKILTVAAIGKLENISLFPIEDPILPVMPGSTQIRFAHLSPNAPNVDITLPDGTVLFGNVGYKEVADYLLVYPGTYILQARLAGTDDIVLYVPNITLLPDRFYTVYAVGLVGETPPLQVLIPLDGNSYIKF